MIENNHEVRKAKRQVSWTSVCLGHCAFCIWAVMAVALSLSSAVCFDLSRGNALIMDIGWDENETEFA